jgi:hypothetical protein
MATPVGPTGNKVRIARQPPRTSKFGNLSAAVFAEWVGDLASTKNLVAASFGHIQLPLERGSWYRQLGPTTTCPLDTVLRCSLLEVIRKAQAQIGL